MPCVEVDRSGSTSRVNSGQLERPEYWLHTISDEAVTLSQKANYRSNLPEMLPESSAAFPDIQEYYLFLALSISKLNGRIKSFK